MIRRRRETKTEKLNKKVHEIAGEIRKDKANYPEWKAILSKLKFISDQIIERITNDIVK